MSIALQRRAAGSLLAAAAALAGGCAGNAPPLAGTERLQLQRCEDLATLSIAPAAVGLPVRGVSIESATRMPELAPYPDADGEHLLPTAPRCVVLGSIAGIDPAAPPIRFAVNLPVAWNGRALQSGGGGLGGAVIAAPNQKASGRFDPIPLNRPYPVTQGYATFGSDGGHQSPDTGFMRSPEAMRNWAVDEMKKTRDVALQIVAAAYGRRASHVFFSGESAGGREAMVMAQRYPADYDGFIATSPVLTWNTIHLADNRIRDRLIDGWLDAPAIRLVAERTRASCDAADGLADGVIARYLECRNDAVALRCPNGQPATGCLSDAQIASVNAIRDPWPVGLTMADGLTRYAGYGVTGDEDGARYQYDFYTVGKQPPSRPLPPGRGFEPGRGAVLNFAAFWVRHAIVQDSAFDPYGFDPRPHARRIQELSSLFDATSPDLSGLARRGARLILLQPSADNAVGTPMIADYYRSVVARMGQAATDQVMRFYVGAGGGHNVTGPSQLDTLALLERWVLQSEAPPDSVPAYEMDPTSMRVLRGMPACRYPMYARYNGSGDPKAAASFTCTSRPDPMAAAASR